MKRRDFVLSAASSMALAHAGAWASATPAAPAAPSLYEPTRYVFVADKMSNFISVIDLVSGKHVESLDFGIRPHVFEMARDDAMMAVASPEATQICFFNLKTRETTRMKLPAPVYQIFFVPQSKLVALGMRDCVGMIDYDEFTLKVFDRKFDSPNRKTVLDSFYFLLFSSFSQSFWVLDEEKPRIFHKYGKDSAKSKWDEIDFSGRIKTNRGFDVGIASPEDYLLTMTTEDGNEGLIYFPESDKLLSTGSMRTTTNTYKPMLMPYIDFYTKNVIFGNKEGQMAHFDLESGSDKPERFTVDFSPRFIRSGWLESTWVLAGDKGIMFQSLKDPADRKVFRFVAEVTNVWVTGDSKTALVTIDEGYPQIIPYDIRTRERLKPILTPGVSMANIIRMSSNNSICY